MCKSEIHSDPQQNDAPDGEVVTNVRRSVLWIAISVAAIALALNFAAKATIKMATAPIETQNFTKGRDYPFFSEFGQLIAWWDPMPDEHHSNVAAVNTSANKSNIHPGDYAGPESCRECHARNYESWSTHSHRYMNAYANESTVKGDFSGNATINYFGGLGEFYREGGEYRMRLTREDILRVYTINQTIGSRFTQYYVGKMTQGPEPTDHDFYKTDHVLPFGYWMDERKWIPIVHVHEVFDDDKQLASDEDLWPSDQRLDPFSEPGFVPYTRCADCHTTFPLADSMIRAPGAIGLHLPNKVHFSMSDYLRAEHPDVWKSDKDPSDFLHSEFNDMTDLTRSWEAPDRAVSLGITWS